MGLRVFGVASKDDGVALVRRLGADGVADGRKKFLRQAREFAPDGFAGALVFAGGNGWKEELQLVPRNGRIAWPNGVEPVPTVPAGVTRKAYDGEDSARYPLEQAAKALKDVQRHHIGKLALKIH